jgi:hypothetical protein
MATKRGDRLAEVIKELEALGRRLRADIRGVAKEVGLTKNLERAAATLRQKAAAVAAQVEKYAHEVRMELSQPDKPTKKAAPKRSAKRPARKKAA